MTTKQAMQCTAVIEVTSTLVPDTQTKRICGAEAQWENENGSPRCEWHAGGHCRRIGPVEGTEA